ncbi:MAG: hypothetical protein ACR2H3_16895 [Acidimicrobiales bacterium]
MSEPFTDRIDTGVPRWREVIEMLGALLVATATVGLLAGVLNAFVSDGVGGLDAADRLSLLANAANLTLSLMLLIGVACAVLPKVALGGPSSPLARPIATVGALVALLVGLLAVSGVLLDLTTGDGRSGGAKLVRVIYRLVALSPAAVAVWVGAVLPSSAASAAGAATGVSAPTPPRTQPPEAR